MKKIKEVITKKLLTDEQMDAVRSSIVLSMKDALEKSGVMAEDNFYRASTAVADRVLHDAQKALLQGKTFDKIIKNSKPLKAKKSK